MKWVTVAAALVWWTRWPVPELSSSRLLRLPIGDSIADDPGLYWIVPHVPADPAHAVWWLSLAAFAMALAWQRTWATRLVLAIMAPLFIATGGPYWIPAFAVWMALPASPRAAGLVGVLVAPFRGVAALPALASAFRSWKTGIVAAAAFLLVTGLGAHVFWHTAYIGLGWLPNPWGISYLDASGMAATTAAYASPEYEAALRSLTIAHVLERPDFVALELVAKLAAALSLAFPWILAIPLAAVRRPALLAPAIGAVIPMLLAVPSPEYATGLVAISLFAVAELVGRGVPAIAVQRPQAVEVPQVARADSLG